jgi:hypothetical protein
MGRSFGWDRINRGPVSQQVWHDKDPSLLKGPERRAYAWFCSPSPVMVTSPCKWNILERDVKQQIINQSIIQTLESGNWKFKFFSKFKRDNSVKNQWDHNQIRTWPAHSYDEPTHAIWPLYIHPNKSWRAETELFFKRDNSVKNHPTMAKFELDLHNHMMYPYTKFEFNVCNRSRDNERKPIYGMTEWRRVTLHAPGHFMAGA